MIVGIQTMAAQIKQGNPLVFGKNRLTIITPTLLRLEYAKDAQFIDYPTLFAYDRTSKLDPSQIKVKELGNNTYEITTPALRIWFNNDNYPFSTSNLHVFYQHNGKERKFTNRQIFRNNLGGPVETLDRVTKEIPMNPGILSKDGWYLIDDTQSDLLVNGWLTPKDTRNHIQDQYCFVYGNDYKAALASLGAISGKVPMTRKYIHGIWYCRYWDYTAQDYLDILDGYNKNDFPLDNLVFDMAWHTNNATVGTGHNGHRNWTGFTWNKELIPDPKALIKALHDQKITVSLNDHPHDGLRPHDEKYADFMQAINRKPGELELFNLGDSIYMKNFFKYAHRPSEDIGVDFWWLDWQQNYLYSHVAGTNTTSLAWINELYYRDSQRNNKRGCGYSRWAGFGDHRHPVQFSGDAQSNWEMLAFEVKLTSGSGNAGCYYWIHDIGGFRGLPNPELTVRWTQFGALSAALRVHSDKDARLDRRPWLGTDQEVKALRKMYHLRSQIMPYVYSSVWQTHRTMVPLNRGMYIEYGDQKESYNQPQQFLFGDLLLAAPITSAGKGENKEASQQVWFPKGDDWYDFFTHQHYSGNQTLHVTKSLDELPLYVKAGWLLPMQPYTNRPGTTPTSTLVMRVYPAHKDVNNTYSLYEDDGISMDYEKGQYATTDLTYMQQGKRVTVLVKPTQGRYKDQLNQRSYQLQIPGKEVPKNIKINRKQWKMHYDSQVDAQIISIPNTDIRSEIAIKYEMDNKK